MTISELIKAAGAEIKVRGDLNKKVTGCYVSDMLSDVLANSKEGNLWITRQTHQNVVGVAVVKELSGIIISGNRDIEPDTLRKAAEENITFATTPLSTFETAGLVYAIFSGKESL